jgi:hypothetical protein
VTREIVLGIPFRMEGSPPSWPLHRWRTWEELTPVCEMMIGHVRGLGIAVIKFIAQRLHRSVPHP